MYICHKICQTSTFYNSKHDSLECFWAGASLHQRSMSCVVFSSSSCGTLAGWLYTTPLVNIIDVGYCLMYILTRVMLLDRTRSLVRLVERLCSKLLLVGGFYKQHVKLTFKHFLEGFIHEGSCFPSVTSYLPLFPCVRPRAPAELA